MNEKEWNGKMNEKCKWAYTPWNTPEWWTVRDELTTSVMRQIQHHMEQLTISAEDDGDMHKNYYQLHEHDLKELEKWTKKLHNFIRFGRFDKEIVDTFLE